MKQLLFALDCSETVVFDQDTELRYTLIYNPHPGFATKDVLGKRDADLLPREDAQVLTQIKQKVLDSGKPEKAEVITTIQGIQYYYMISVVPVIDDSGKIRGITCASTNITKLKHLEKTLSKARQLESLGTLAGGIAHDFNNLMGGIFGYIDNACYATRDRNVKTILLKAMATIDRARALTSQLLTFAKGGAPIQKIGNLFPFVQETAQSTLSGTNVSCSFAIASDLWQCNFDTNQIGQVIENIVRNAQEAMPSGGKIEVSAENSRISENEHSLLAKGNYIKLSIRDFGIGMSKELMSRIFDPYFTTKPTGHGLGLTSSYSIAKRHGGCIDVTSEQNKGTIFHVYLPATPGSVAAESA